MRSHRLRGKDSTQTKLPPDQIGGRSTPAGTVRGTTNLLTFRGANGHELRSH